MTLCQGTVQNVFWCMFMSYCCWGGYVALCAAGALRPTGQNQVRLNPTKTLTSRSKVISFTAHWTHQTFVVLLCFNGSHFGGVASLKHNWVPVCSEIGEPGFSFIGDTWDSEIQGNPKPGPDLGQAWLQEKTGMCAHLNWTSLQSGCFTLHQTLWQHTRHLVNCKCFMWVLGAEFTVFYC